MTTILLRRGAAATWTSEAPTLAAGELGIETDTGRVKIGDGVTAWGSLAYSFESYTLANITDAGGAAALDVGTIAGTVAAGDDARFGGTPADGSITMAKLADLAQDKLIGRATASTGVPEAIACTAAGRALLDDATNTDQRTTLGLGTAAVAATGDFAAAAHAASHKSAGGDSIRLDEFAAPSGSVNFNDQQATSFRIENRTSDPASPTVGQLWLRTDL